MVTLASFDLKFCVSYFKILYSLTLIAWIFTIYAGYILAEKELEKL